MAIRWRRDGHQMAAGSRHTATLLHPSRSGRRVAKLERMSLGDGSVHLLGSVQGFVPDGEEVSRLLEEVRPAAVGLGVPPEDMEALRVLSESEAPEQLIGQTPPQLSRAATPAGGAPGAEAILGGGRRDAPTGADDDAPFASLDPVQEHFLGLVSRFGPVRLPSPDLEAAFAWAKANDVRIEALDLDDEAHAEFYIRANRFRDVLRSGRIQKKLLKADFDAASSDELAVAWDAFQNRLPSLQKVEQAREKEMAKRIRELAPGKTVVAVVPVARMDGVLAALRESS